MKDYKEYKGTGRPVLVGDYVDVKLINGEKIAGYGRDFHWWEGEPMTEHDIEFYRLRGSALSPVKQPGSPDTLIKFTKYNGKGCPFNDDDYLRVKLISGKIVCKFAALFSWWTSIDGMDRHDLAQLDIDSYSLMTPSVQSVVDNKIKYDGGGCPVDGETIVLYWLFSNKQPFSNYAKNLKWRIDGQPVSESDVEYFAFVKPPKKSDNKNDKIKYDGKGCPVDPDSIVNSRKHGKKCDVRSHNIGDSDYAKHKIQPWDVWLEYNLNGWDCDIVKRVLRDKESQSRRMDYEKIIHDCQERIRQIDEESEKGDGAEHF